MIVDTSALVAVINGEEEALRFARLLHDLPVKMSAATLFEFGMVVDRYRNPALSAAADILIEQVEADIVPVDADLARAARDAYRRFGKGHHPARLNFGDCFAYALAELTGEALLFKGEDFALTDVRAAA